MSDFVSQPPSQKAPPVGAFFRGGMMPATGSNVTTLIVFDLRSLRLPIAEGQAIEKELRATLTQELAKRNLTTNRTATDLTGAVFGIAVD